MTNHAEDNENLRVIPYTATSISVTKTIEYILILGCRNVSDHTKVNEYASYVITIFGFWVSINEHILSM